MAAQCLVVFASALLVVAALGDAACVGMKAKGFCESVRYNVSSSWVASQGGAAKLSGQAADAFDDVWATVKFRTADCNQKLRVFLCQLQFPRCAADHPEQEFRACRSTCREVNRVCRLALDCPYKYTDCIENMAHESRLWEFMGLGAMLVGVVGLACVCARATHGKKKQS